jgi:hypothetical protein
LIGQQIARFLSRAVSSVIAVILVLANSGALVYHFFVYLPDPSTSAIEPNMLIWNVILIISASFTIFYSTRLRHRTDGIMLFIVTCIYTSTSWLSWYDHYCGSILIAIGISIVCGIAGIVAVWCWYGAAPPAPHLPLPPDQICHDMAATKKIDVYVATLVTAITVLRARDVDHIYEMSGSSWIDIGIVAAGLLIDIVALLIIYYWAPRFRLNDMWKLHSVSSTITLGLYSYPNWQFIRGIVDGNFDDILYSIVIYFWIALVIVRLVAWIAHIVLVSVSLLLVPPFLLFQMDSRNSCEW